MTVMPETALRGRLGTLSEGLDLHARWDGQRLVGRVGSFTAGHDVVVALTGDGLAGRVGSFTRGFGLRAEVLAGELHLRLGGVAGKDARLDFTPEGATGRYGRFTDGLDLALRHYAGEVRGRFGGYTTGTDFRMDLGDVPLPLAAMLAVSALCLWREDMPLTATLD